MSYPPQGNKADISGLATAADLATLDAKVALNSTVAKDATVAKAVALATVGGNVDTLLTRLSAVRSAYLDELAAANMPADLDTLKSRLTAARSEYLDELPFIEHHDHNIERWFGKSADQSGTNWATEGSLTAFQPESGNADFGTAVKVLGSTDTPVIAGRTFFDLHRLFVAATSVASVYIIRMIYGTGDDADIEEAAGRYSDVVFMRESAAGRGNAIDFRMSEHAVGFKHWAKIKNANNGATLDFYFGLHEYPYS